MKNTHGGVLILVKLQPATLLKVTLLHGCFSRFLTFTNDTKSRKASHIIMEDPGRLNLNLILPCLSHQSDIFKGGIRALLSTLCGGIPRSALSSTGNMPLQSYLTNSCHWSLSIPPENIRKGFLFSGGMKKEMHVSDMKWVKWFHKRSISNIFLTHSCAI